MNDNEVITGTLEQWYVEYRDSQDVYIIFGNVHSDSKERFSDGYFIRTSGISKKSHPIDLLKECSVVHTRNSVYVLGLPFKVADM